MALTANFEADFSKFYDAVQQAVVELDGFEKGAAKAEQSLDRMANRFSGAKVIQDATLMAEAIERLGGVSTLTEQELARVGKTAGEAVAKMSALGLDVPKNLQDLANATKGAGDETESLGLSVGKLAASYITAEAAIRLVEGAYHMLVDATKAVIASASEAEQVDSALLAALEAQGTAVPSVVKAYDEYAQALQATTRYSDDAVKAAERILAQVGNVMPRDMERATKATADLAAALNIDLSQAAMMVAKAAEGQTGALKKAGIVIEETKGETVDFGVVLDQLETKLGGAAEAAGNTFAGQLDKLSNAWDNLLEATGRVITNNETARGLFAGLTEIVTGNTEELNDNASANETVSDAVILVAKGLVLAVDGLDILQHSLQATRLLLDSFAGAALFVYQGLQKIELATQKPLAWAGSEEAAQRVREAGEAMQWAGEKLDALNGDINNARATSAAWHERLEGLTAQLTALEARLEETRGQTHALAATQDEDAAAWERQTQAVKAQEEALAAGRAEWERVGNEVDAVAKRAIKASDDALKHYDAQQATYSALMAQYSKVVGSMSHDTLTAQLNDIDAVTQAKLDSLATQEGASQASSDLIIGIAEAQKQALIQKTLESDPLTKAHYVMLAEQAEAAYNQALRFADQYTAGAIDALRRTRDAAESTLKNWEAAADASLAHVGATARGTAGAIGTVNDQFLAMGHRLDTIVGLTGKVAAGAGYATQQLAAMTLTADYVDRMYTHPESVPQGFSMSAWLLSLPGLTAPPGKAAGGPVSAGTQYMVGEQGPELFVPNVSGTIMPAGSPASASADTTDKQLDDLDRWLSAQTAALEKTDKATGDTYDGMDRASEAYYRKLASDADAAYQSSLDDAATYTTGATQLLKGASAMAQAELVDWQVATTAVLGGIAEAAKVTADAMSYVMGMSAANQQAGIGPFDPATALAQLGTSDLDELASIAGYKTNVGGGYAGGVNNDIGDVTLARQLLAYFLGGGVVPGMPTDMGGSTLFPHFGFMAAGGPVDAGAAYMVGERGPELFVPGSSGTIVPNGGGGATVNIAAGAFVLNYPIVNNPQALDQLARTVGDALLTKLTRTGARL